MTFIIAALILYIALREKFFAQKLWFYETLVVEMPFDSVMLDNKGRFRVISSASIKDPEKRRWMIGKTNMDYWIKQRKDPEPGRKRLEIINRAIENRALESIEETTLDKEGQERVHLRMIKPIFDSNGKHRATMGFSYELTAIKQKERELCALNKELKRSNEDLDNFAHVASHDLRTPLRSISSFLQLYVRKNHTRFDDTDKEYIQFISKGAKQMDSLIQSLLSYSSIDRYEVTPKPTNLSKTVDSVQLSLSSFVKERRAHIIVSPLPTIITQDFLMFQLFQNLVGNGIKYNKSDMPTVEIFVTNSEEGMTTYAVRDNGIGISMQYKDIVFKIFQRLHGVDAYEGTGIGLAACKRIVELYGGKIWFESDNVGTTFYFTLPNCSVVETPELKHIAKMDCVLVA